MSDFRSRWRAELDAIAAEHRYRRRRVVQRLSLDEPMRVTVDGCVALNFCSNDYLGLSTHSKLREAAEQAIRMQGVGSGAAHLVTGHSHEHHALEEELAAFVGRERALLFSTGYMANLGVASALIKRGDAVFEDRLNHASLLDAGLLSGARFARYGHNDVADLRYELVNSNAATKLVLSDGVFSMDGDIAPISQLAQLCTEHQAALMIDDAHGFGVLGIQGQGSVHAAGLDANQVPIYMATLGKALGTAGAFVAGDEELIELLIQKARTYIYTTAMPPALAAASRAALRVLQAEPDHLSRLHANIAAFKQGAAALGLSLMKSNTAIQPLILGEAALALCASEQLLVRGFMVSAIRPPTVPEGTSRLRITLSAAHRPEHIDALLDALRAVTAELMS